MPNPYKESKNGNRNTKFKTSAYSLRWIHCRFEICGFKSVPDREGGQDDFVAVLTSARYLRENGIDIPAKGKEAVSTETTEEKPEVKKKK